MFQGNSESFTGRIALLSGTLSLGGSTTFLINLAGELGRRGIPTQVLSLERENPLAGDFTARQIPTFCWDQHRMIFEDRLTGVMQQLARFQPTVVVANLGASSFEALRYLPAGVFRIGVGHSDDPSVYAMIRHYAPFLDAGVMVSAVMRQKAAAMPEFAQVPMHYLPCGVPMCPEAEVPVRDWNRPLRILYLGRLIREQKRVHLFPEIWRQLEASGMPIHWTIIGEGPERAGLEAQLKSAFPHQKATFTGPLPYAEVPAVVKQQDVFLLASDHEGLPLSLLEAMGYGLVPVVSDLPSGVAEVVNSGNGFPVSIDDVAGYARAILHLHAHRNELAAKSAAARRTVAEKFSVEAMADRWLGLLPAPRKTADWPQRWNIRAPLPAPKKFLFSPPLRMLRRAAAKFRARQP